jgi:hypothetical protein
MLKYFLINIAQTLDAALILTVTRVVQSSRCHCMPASKGEINNKHSDKKKGALTRQLMKDMVLATKEIITIHYKNML